MAKIFTKAFWDDEGSKAVVSIIAGFIGILLALRVNDHTEEKNREDAFTSMCKAINSEAVYNKTVLEESFLPNYQQNIVQREFSLRIAEGYFMNEIFLSKASPALLDELIKYQLQLKRANNFRATDAMYKYEPAKFQQWQAPLTVAFYHSLNRCAYSIAVVAQRTSSRSNRNTTTSVPTACPEVIYADASITDPTQSKLNRKKSINERVLKKSSKSTAAPILGPSKISAADSNIANN